MFTLRDLEAKAEGDETWYRFPKSVVTMRREMADHILVICNYTGKLTDTVDPATLAKIIVDIGVIKERLNIE